MKNKWDAGTDDHVHIVFYFPDQSKCQTGGLDRYGNDFTKGSLRTYCDTHIEFSGDCKG